MFKSLKTTAWWWAMNHFTVAAAVVQSAMYLRCIWNTTKTTTKKMFDSLNSLTIIFPELFNQMPVQTIMLVKQTSGDESNTNPNRDEKRKRDTY